MNNLKVVLLRFISEAGDRALIAGLAIGTLLSIPLFFITLLV